jgi:hypothetical protein
VDASYARAGASAASSVASATAFGGLQNFYCVLHALVFLLLRLVCCGWCLCRLSMECGAVGWLLAAYPATAFQYAGGVVGVLDGTAQRVSVARAVASSLGSFSRFSRYAARFSLLASCFFLLLASCVLRLASRRAPPRAPRALPFFYP